MNVEVQVAPLQATALPMSPKVESVRTVITIHFKFVMVPLASAQVSIGDSSISAIPNPILAERGAIAVAA